MNKKNCNNCAWFCHADGRCWKDSIGENPAYPMTVKKDWYCGCWTFDGLEDWEREDTDALMAMDEVNA